MKRVLDDQLAKSHLSVDLTAWVIRYTKGVMLVELDPSEIHQWIINEASSDRRPVEESMNALIDYCESNHPHPDWAKLRMLPYGDLTEMREWIETPFREEPSEVPLMDCGSDCSIPISTIELRLRTCTFAAASSSTRIQKIRNGLLVPNGGRIHAMQIHPCCMTSIKLPTAKPRDC